MKILITGTARGIGKTVAERFISLDNEVIGLDLLPSSIENERYTHYECDVKKARSLPGIDGVNIIFVNAGQQNGRDDIGNNLVLAGKPHHHDAESGAEHDDDERDLPPPGRVPD